MWLVVALVIVLFFYAPRLPEVFKGMGEATREFKKGIDEGDSSQKK